MLRKLILGSSSWMLLGATALAADLPVVAKVPPAAAQSWAGFYLGVHGGYGWGNNNFREYVVHVDPFPFFVGVASKGALVGAHAGYNWQFGRAVGGLEIDWSAADINGSSARLATDVPAFGFLTADRIQSVKYLGTARGRLGWLPADNVLLKPIRFGRFRKSGVRVSIIAMAGIVCFSAFAFRDGGIPARFPKEIRSALALMKYDPEIDARYPNCWLAVTTPFESYGEECRTGGTLIWGDSHAARLFTGFKESATEIAQFTRSSCMPSLSNGRQIVCDASNAGIVEEIVRLKPKRVIIFAAWLNYDVNWQLHDERVEAVRRALKRLKPAVDDVVLVGPSPSWTPDLPTAVYRFWTADRRLPDRLQPAPKGYHEVDVVLAAIAHEEGARFISVFNKLCDVDGCLTHTPASASDLLSWDYGHLTTSGARSILEALQLD